MSLSLTFPAKKFQLFQPIGGVSAAWDVAGVCDEAVIEARARTASGSKTKLRMIFPLSNDFRVNSMPMARLSAIGPRFAF
jgi:hypothetical protein